jgi:hypothetical protein
MVGIVLRGGKNNQFGRNEIRYQFATGDPLLCPVRGLAWIRIANRIHKAQPLGTNISCRSEPWGRDGHVVQLLKEVTTTLGLNAANYLTHSIRIGGSTALLNSGANPLVIKLLGRWLSDCYQSYPVLTSKGTVGVSKLMCLFWGEECSESRTGLGAPSIPHHTQERGLA